MKRTARFYLYKIATTPPHKLAKTVVRKFIEKIQHQRSRRRILSKRYQLPTDAPGMIAQPLIPVDRLDGTALDREVCEFLVQRVCEHRFDLLGSGWVKNSYHAQPLGMGGYRYDHPLSISSFDERGDWLAQVVSANHLAQAQAIWQQIQAPYEPIDWQLDYKSGYRWDALAWFMDQRIGALPGVDIKVPWELARMQHFPQLASIAIAHPHLSETIIREFKHQMLDFMATNPVEMGVNWRCTMDVAIRAANMLMAYDVLRQIDRRPFLDAPFQHVFSQYIYEHGRFIFTHLEWSDVLTSNHYLSNVCGLSFVAAYLESTAETDRWLRFAIQELKNEVRKQFYADGSNFEGSTSYHRLSAEMVVYTTALIIGLRESQPKRMNELQPFDSSYVRTLYLSGWFSLEITKPNGEITQIGDNDSGRFIRLSPNGTFLTREDATAKYIQLQGYDLLDTPLQFWDESTLSHATLLSALNGLYDESNFAQVSAQFPLERSFIQALARSQPIHVPYVRPAIAHAQVNWPPLIHTQMTTYPLPEGAEEGLHFVHFPDFGLYLLKNERLFISLMAGPNGQNGNAGHAHNDKGSIELQVEGVDVLKDPGTYVYTPLPDERNRFRSVTSHHTIVVEQEEQNQYLTLFSMKDETQCGLLAQHNTMMQVYVTYRQVMHRRTVQVEAGRVIVTDECNHPFRVNVYEGEHYSDGYGKLICHPS